MANRPRIQPRPVTEDKRPALPNREALRRAQAAVDAQLPTRDSIDDAVSGPPHRRGPGSPDEPGGRDYDDDPDAPLDPVAGSGGELASTLSDDGLTELKTREERHEQRIGWFYAEAARQAENRRLMARDEAYYDCHQWSPEDAAVLKGRGQTPVVYNEIAPTIDFLIGTERRSRVDFVVVAEDAGDEAAEDAIVKTKVLKYLDDVNMAPFERSYAANDCFKAGLGVLEVGLRGDKTGTPVFVGSESWRNFLFDSRAKRDQSDARYNFRVKEVDLDVALAMFPDHADELRTAAISGDDSNGFLSSSGINGVLAGLDSFSYVGIDTYNGATRAPVEWFNTRSRVTIIECWSREPVRRRLQGGLGDPVEFRVRVSLMIESCTLVEEWSPFKHDRFPFVLLWAYRDANGMPYGPARRLIGPQDGLNRRMARTLFEASFNQTDVEKGAVDRSVMNEEELLKELNDPNGMPMWADGAISGGKVRQRNNPGAAQYQFMLAQADRAALRDLSGVNNENRGLDSSATSRVAMDAKAERGSVQTAELFDNLLMARQIEGELTLSTCEQFMVRPMTIRVAGESGAAQRNMVAINQPQADGSFLNDMSARRSHFVVGEQAWKQSYAEAAFNSLMQVMTQLASAAPQVVISLLDIVFDMHPNLPRKKAVLERIRSVNGQADPEGKLTPEQQAERQKQAQMAQAQFELQMAQLKADVDEVRAKGQKLSVEAVGKRVEALYQAAQAAQVLAMTPAVTPIADQILASAGYDDQSGTLNTLGPAAMLAPPGGMAAAAMPELQQSDGIGHGIETMRPDGAMGGLAQ